MGNPTIPLNAGQAAAQAQGTIRTTRPLPFDAPWNWLAAGWRDLWSIPALSLGYGAIFAITAAAIAAGLWMRGWHSLFLALAAGFLLVGPLFGAGLYTASYSLSRAEPVRLRDMVLAGFRARGQLAFFGAILMFAYLIWLQLAFLLLMLFLGGNGLPPPAQFMPVLLFTPSGLGLLVVGAIVGGLIAAMVFVGSVFAVPALMIERIDAISAMRQSIRTVVANPKPMALWAGLIAVMIGAGFFTLFVGLVFAFPLIGHATWHAYADAFGAEPRA